MGHECVMRTRSDWNPALGSATSCQNCRIELLAFRRRRSSSSGALALAAFDSLHPKRVSCDTFGVEIDGKVTSCEP